MFHVSFSASQKAGEKFKQFTFIEKVGWAGAGDEGPAGKTEKKTERGNRKKNHPKTCRRSETGRRRRVNRKKAETAQSAIREDS